MILEEVLTYDLFPPYISPGFHATISERANFDLREAVKFGTHPTHSKRDIWDKKSDFKPNII